VSFVASTSPKEERAPLHDRSAEVAAEVVLVVIRFRAPCRIEKKSFELNFALRRNS